MEERFGGAMSTHQQQSRSAVSPAAQIEWPCVGSAVLWFAIAVPFIGFLIFVRVPLVLPSISVVALASAALIALTAWWMSSDRNSTGVSLWDVSGAYAFMGFAAGMLSDPQQVVEFWSVPAQVHEPAR
jgi:hypothetical protein